MIATSLITGTLWSRCTPGASRQAAMSFSTEFFAPFTWTLPSQRAGRTENEAIHGETVVPRKRARGTPIGPLSSAAVSDQRQAPDRNLAMELVRVTEAAALAAGRWMGRGDKEGADRAAVDAMRVVLQRVPMDGIVVIGEGEKDEAPMLFNGERIGDGTPPMTDIAVDPIDGTTLTALGPRRCPRGDRRLRAGNDVRPGTLRLHGEDRRRPRGRPRHRHHREPGAQPGRGRAGKGRVGERPHRRRARPRAAPRADRQVYARPAPGSSLITDGDVAGAIATAWPESGVDVLIGHRAGRPKASSRRRPSSAWAARSKAASGRATTPSGRGARGRLRPRPGPHGQTTLCAGTIVSSRQQG